MNIRDFYQGREFYAQDYLGARPVEKGVLFRTYAPGAGHVQVMWYPHGQKTPEGWDLSYAIDMHRVEDGKFWECWVEHAEVGDLYEYRIYRPGGSGAYQDHADPYAMASELRPGHRSRVADLMFDWTDSAWMAQRDRGHNRPVNIYEMHAGSWRKRSGEKCSSEVEDWYTYTELAEMLPAYLKEMGYNYVEFLPLNEHPFDGSWGYQPTGFFCPTSRYGSPTDLMALIDALHAEGIGCLLDIVPVHFASDAWGLANYDSTPLFEYPNAVVGVSEWGSHNFMYSRGETCSFMQSSANFWLGAYHFDGLRMDAISRIIYWMGDERRGINREATKFVASMNAGLHSLNPGAILIAEDSTDFRGTTAPAAHDGLDFDYKWDMGWMHDTLEFFQTPPEARSDHYHKLSFSMMYYANERYLLPLSHDEVVHGKATIAQKMWGDYELKFPQARALYLYMMAHPGKKLNFMGSEIAQLREWDEDREQDWFLTKYPLHDAFWRYCADLNAAYLAHPALWEGDYRTDSNDPAAGFRWVKIDDPGNVVYGIERRSPSTGERVVIVLNLSDHAIPAYDIVLDAEAAAAAQAAPAAPAVVPAAATATAAKTAKAGKAAKAAKAAKSGKAANAKAAATESAAPATEPAAPAAKPAAEILINSDWDIYGGSTPKPATAAESVQQANYANGTLTVALAPFSGLAVKLAR